MGISITQYRSALGYWIMDEKGKIIACTTIINLNAEKRRGLNIYAVIMAFWKLHLEVTILELVCTDMMHL